MPTRLYSVPHSNVTDLSREQPPMDNAEKWLDSLLLFAALQRPTQITLHEVEMGPSGFKTKMIQARIEPVSSARGGHIRPLDWRQLSQLGRLLESRLRVPRDQLVHVRFTGGTDYGTFEHEFGDLHVMTIHAHHPISKDPKNAFTPLQFDLTYHAPEAA